jgi:hypothetical protein
MPISLQEFADESLALEYRQPLKTLEEACDVHGWAHIDKPICCGKEVEIQSCIGHAYFAQCQTCKKFILDVTGPKFSETGSAVQFLDADKVQIDTDKRWAAGTEAA